MSNHFVEGSSFKLFHNYSFNKIDHKKKSFICTVVVTQPSASCLCILQEQTQGIKFNSFEIERIVIKNKLFKRRRKINEIKQKKNQRELGNFLRVLTFRFGKSFQNRSFKDRAFFFPYRQKNLISKMFDEVHKIC